MSTPPSPTSYYPTSTDRIQALLSTLPPKLQNNHAYTQKYTWWKKTLQTAHAKNTIPFITTPGQITESFKTNQGAKPRSIIQVCNEMYKSGDIIRINENENTSTIRKIVGFIWQNDTNDDMEENTEIIFKETLDQTIGQLVKLQQKEPVVYTETLRQRQYVGEIRLRQEDWNYLFKAMVNNGQALLQIDPDNGKEVKLAEYS